MDSVTRYVLTYVNTNGMRQMLGAAQGRNTYETEAAATQHLQATLENNSSDLLEHTYGHPSRGNIEVRPVECWPNHFDPKTVWFD